MHETRYRYIELQDRFRVVKGSISFIGQDTSLSVMFMYNPAEVVRRHGWGHGSEAVPGRSHPAYGGGAGTEESFDFTLQLDADRGNYDRRRSRNPSGNEFEVFDALVQRDAANNGPRLSQLENLRPLPDQFFQLVKPEGDPSQPEGQYNVPARIFLELGSVLRGEVGIDSLEEGIFHYGPQHNVLKANLHVRGHVIETSNVTNTILIERTAELSVDPQPSRGSRRNRIPGLISGG